MTNKKKARARKLSQKTGMSHQAAVNALTTPGTDRIYTNPILMMDELKDYLTQTGCGIFAKGPAIVTVSGKKRGVEPNELGFITVDKDGAQISWGITQESLTKYLDSLSGDFLEGNKVTDLQKASVVAAYLGSYIGRTKLALAVQGAAQHSGETRQISVVHAEDGSVEELIPGPIRRTFGPYTEPEQFLGQARRDYTSLKDLLEDLVTYLTVTGYSVDSHDEPRALRMGFVTAGRPFTGRSIAVESKVYWTTTVSAIKQYLSETAGTREAEVTRAALKTAEGRAALARFLGAKARNQRLGVLQPLKAPLVDEQVAVVTSHPVHEDLLQTLLDMPEDI